MVFISSHCGGLLVGGGLGGDGEVAGLVNGRLVLGVEETVIVETNLGGLLAVEVAGWVEKSEGEENSRGELTMTGVPEAKDPQLNRTNGREHTGDLLALDEEDIIDNLGLSAGEEGETLAGAKHGEGGSSVALNDGELTKEGRKGGRTVATVTLG